MSLTSNYILFFLDVYFFNIFFDFFSFLIFIFDSKKYHSHFKIKV